MRNYSVYTGSLILVNGNHPIRETSGKPDLAPLDGGSEDALMERRAAVLLDRLMEGIGGWSEIAAVSGWRSRREQQELWDRSIKENGPEFTSKFVAPPGRSEHQTGLAVDLGLKAGGLDLIRPDFPDTGICRAFRRAAPDFGFVERYPREKESLTGISHEPWYFRYVGTPHAEIMTGLGLTLEEYHDFLRRFHTEAEPFIFRMGGLSTEISYQPADGDGELRLKEDGCPRTISGNNMDGYIVTVWKDGR